MVLTAEYDQAAAVTAAEYPVYGNSVGSEVHRHVAAGCPFPGQGVILLSATVQVRSTAQIFDVAVPLSVHPRKASRQFIFNERPGQSAIEIDHIVITNNGFDGCIEFLGWFLVNKVHCTANGVSAIEGALRAPQYFDTVNVPEALDRCGI